jgi:hypothetical protein
MRSDRPLLTTSPYNPVKRRCTVQVRSARAAAASPFGRAQTPLSRPGQENRAQKMTPVIAQATVSRLMPVPLRAHSTVPATTAITEAPNAMATRHSPLTTRPGAPQATR